MEDARSEGGTRHARTEHSAQDAMRPRSRSHASVALSTSLWHRTWITHEFTDVMSQRALYMRGASGPTR